MTSPAGHLEPAAQAAVDRLADDPPRSGLLLDFDGTLAPLVTDPTTSALTEMALSALERLAPRLGVVAVVSGRPAAFLAARVPVAGVRRLGLYGLEEADADGTVRVRPDAEAWRELVAGARGRLQRTAAGVEGAWVEDKGLSVAVHWRQAPDHAAAAAALEPVLAALAEATGLAREPGKLVDELRPPVARDKGAVVDELAEAGALAEVAYVGDDLGDLPALQAARRRGGLAIVVDHGDDTPDELRAVADARVAGVEGVGELLACLARRV